MSLTHSTIEARSKLAREKTKEKENVVYHDKENLLELFVLADMIRKHPDLKFPEVLEMYLGGIR